MIKVIAILLLFPAPLILRVVIGFFPGEVAGLAFWLCLIVGTIAVGNYVMLPGMLCNAAAMLANNGVMPVYGSDDVSGPLHVQGTPDMALQFLCDRYWGSSVGDFLILGGMLYIAMAAVWRRAIKVHV